MSQTNTIYRREAFLKRLKDKLEDQPYQPYELISDLPHRQLADLSVDELIEVAKERANKVNADFIQTDHAHLNNTIEDIIQKCDKGPIIVPTDPQFDQYQVILDDKHSVYQWQIGSEFREENIMAAEKSNIAIAFAQYFLAESASAVVETSPGQGRSLHFLPTHYISIIPKSRIVKRSTQAAEAFDKNVTTWGPPSTLFPDLPTQETLKCSW